MLGSREMQESSADACSRPPMISVVIATLNREEPLCNTLRYFLEAETYRSFEVIVIDQSDGHLEATRDFLARNGDGIRYVPVDYKSLPKARNHGVRLAKGEIVVFVDDDVEPVPGFLLAHARCYVDSDVVGVAGRVFQRGQSLDIRSDVDFPSSAEWAVGCNMSFRRTLIIDLGGFDEMFNRAAIGEDAEFSHRAKKRGKLCYASDARLVHLQVPSGGCRDAASRREHLYHVAFCVNYFWYRMDARFLPRWRMVWRAFRRHVLNRTELRAGTLLQSALGFAEGLWKSSVHIRGLARLTRYK